MAAEDTESRCGGAVGLHAGGRKLNGAAPID